MTVLGAEALQMQTELIYYTYKSKKTKNCVIVVS